MPVAYRDGSTSLQRASSTLQTIEKLSVSNEPMGQKMIELTTESGCARLESSEKGSVSAFLESSLAPTGNPMDTTLRPKDMLDYLLGLIEKEECRSFATILFEKEGKYGVIILHIMVGEVYRSEMYDIDTLCVEYLTTMERLKKVYA